MAGLQTDSGSDLNRSGTIPGVTGGTLGAVPTGLAVTLTEVNRQQALGGWRVEPARPSGRKSQGPFLPKIPAERTLTSNKQKTKNTNNSPVSLVALRRIYGPQTHPLHLTSRDLLKKIDKQKNFAGVNKETIFSQGDASDAMFYIQDGNVKTHGSLIRAEQISNRLQAGSGGSTAFEQFCSDGVASPLISSH
jgi:hypothetical protein